MARNRFKYNPETCRYEPYRISGKVLRNKILLFLTLSFTIGLAGYYWTIEYFESFDEMLLTQKNHALKVQWNILHGRILKNQQELTALIQKDDENYRIILDSEPLAPSIREAGIGGSEKLDLKPVLSYPYMANDLVLLQKVTHKLAVEIQSYQELEEIMKDKLLAWAARPAIQPINNTQLERLHLTYGTRLHPIFNVIKDHKGLDFAAPLGTPVYATGDGKVINVYTSESYGNVIYVDHGYHYETRYAHLSKFAVVEGETVKRGQLIGYVGNTGNSVAPHLHYEVLFKGEHVNPINFFQRDLSNSEYQKLIESASENSFSLD
jgi:murein DD-endopeptidase MepM/ murein hydrolase activator NlpD